MNINQTPHDSLEHLINTIKSYILEIESMPPSEHRNVAMMYGSIHQNFHLLLPQDFKQTKDYEFYKEFGKRTNDNLMQVYESVINSDEAFVERNYLMVRIALSSMLIGLES